MEPKRVVIVESGLLKQEIYTGFIEMVKETMEMATRPAKDATEKPQQAVTVRVVSWMKDAERLAAENQIDSVIFISTGMIREAEDLNRKFPKLTIYVFIGQPIPGKPYIIPKSLVANDSLQQLARQI
jgi:hypothetical protein